MSVLPLSGISFSGLTAALPFFGVLAAAVLAYFGARYSATAPLQASLNDAFRTLMQEWEDKQEEWLKERAYFIARISVLEGEILRQRGVINQGIQREQSAQNLTERLLRRSGDLD